MRGEWPHGAITGEIAQLVSGKSGKEVRDRLPIERLSSCGDLLAALIRELDLPQDTDPVKQEELALRVLTEVMQTNLSSDIQMVRELIGLSAYTPEEIAKILDLAVDSQVRKEDRPKGQKAKSCRQYLAGYGQQPRLRARAVATREKELPASLDKAIFSYIDKQFDSAQEIARSIGLVPQSDEELSHHGALDPFAPDPDTPLLAIETTSEPYVRRSSLEAQFRRLRHESAPVICFVGPRAMGKTTLVEELTRTEKASGAVTIRIDAGGNEQLVRSLRAALLDSGEPLPDSLPALEAAFRKYVTGKPPWFFFIDNVADSTLLTRLVPSGLGKPVVVTANRTLRHIPPEHCIQVERLEPHESTELILRLRPGTTKEDANRLAGTLAHHPMAITAACGMLAADDHLAVSEFVRGLKSVASTVFDGDSDGSVQSLTSIYRQTLASLERADPAARLVLELVAHLGEDVIHSSIIVASLSYVPGYEGLTLTQRKVVAKRAISHLTTRFLVNTSDDGIRVHQLAQAIIRGLTNSQASDRRAVLLSGMAKVAELVARAPQNQHRELFKVFTDAFSGLGTHLTTVCNREFHSEKPSLMQYAESSFMACALILTAMRADLVRILVAVVPSSGGSYRMMLTTRPGELPLQLGFAFNLADLEAAVGPSGKLVNKTGMRRYTFGDERVQIPVMLIARAEDLEDKHTESQM